MNTDGSLLRDVYEQLQDDPSGTITPIGWDPDEDDATRSRKNILQWRSFLPKDCVDTMIRMGWDFTT